MTVCFSMPKSVLLNPGTMEEPAVGVAELPESTPYKCGRIKVATRDGLAIRIQTVGVNVARIIRLHFGHDIGRIGVGTPC